MYQVELVLTRATLVWERKSVLFPKLAGFTNLCLPATKFGQTEHHLFRLQVLKPLVVDVAYPLCHKSMSDSAFCPFVNIVVPPLVESRMNIIAQ